jgi:hypothetical protein
MKRPKREDFNIEGPVTDEERAKALEAFATDLVRRSRMNAYYDAEAKWNYENGGR